MLFDEAGAVLGSTLAQRRGRRRSCAGGGPAARACGRVPLGGLDHAARGLDGRGQRVRRARRDAQDRRDDRTRRPRSDSSSTTSRAACGTRTPSRRSPSARGGRRRTMRRKVLGGARFRDRHLRRQRPLPPLVREAARPDRRLLRRRLDGLVRRGLARGREAPAGRRRRARRRPAVTAQDPLAAALVEHAYLEGDFLLRSGKRSRYYLDKYRFETRPELLRPARRADRGHGARPRARCHPPRRTRARGGRARSGSLPRLWLAVPDRAQAGEGATARKIGSKAHTTTESASASSKTSSPPAARCSTRSRRCVGPASSCTRPSASSTARKAERTRSPAKPFGYGRSFAYRSSLPT